MPKGFSVNLTQPLPLLVIIGGIVVLVAVFLIGVLFVKNHPKANKENR
jgi:uncharacterized membrane protein